MLPVAVPRSSTGGVVISYILLVLSTTSRLPTIGQAKATICLISDSQRAPGAKLLSTFALSMFCVIRNIVWIFHVLSLGRKCSYIATAYNARPLNTSAAVLVQRSNISPLYHYLQDRISCSPAGNDFNVSKWRGGKHPPC